MNLGGGHKTGFDNLPKLYKKGGVALFCIIYVYEIYLYSLKAKIRPDFLRLKKLQKVSSASFWC